MPRFADALLAPAKLTRRSLLAALVALPCLAASGVVVLASTAAQTAQPLSVFAPASLSEALTEVAQAFTAQGQPDVTLSFAGSSSLARQIGVGAPADVFISANALWMDDLEARGRILPDTRRNIAGNGLVVIGHGPQPPLPTLSGAALQTALGAGRLSLALVEAVPAGIYARTALQNLDLWDAVADRTAQADNVRAALAYVAVGAAPIGIVYRTDAQAEPRVSVLAEIPPDSHPSIVYPAAVVGALTGTPHPAAADFVAFLTTPEAQAIFRAYGFLPSLESPAS